MNSKSIYKILIILILTSFISGCSFIKNITNNSKMAEDEMNIGNAKGVMQKGENLYFIDRSDENKLYVVDNQFERKKLISDRYFLEIVNISDEEIYFTEKVMLDGRKTPVYKLSSISLYGDSYNVIVDNVIFAEFLNDKFYYFRRTDEQITSGFYDNAYNYSNFCVFDNKLKKEIIIDERKLIKRIYMDLVETYNGKVYYCYETSFGYKLMEYNPNTKKKIQLKINTNSCRYADNDIYTFCVGYIEKLNLLNNKNTVILHKAGEIGNIFDMNITKDYIFFLAEDRKAFYDKIYRLNLYRVKKDGTELKKIYSSDYTRFIYEQKHHIHNLGNKILLYETDIKNALLSRSLFQLIDYDGNEINSFVLND